MKKVLLALALVVMSSAAHAACNPKIELGADLDNDQNIEIGFSLTFDLGFKAKCDKLKAEAAEKEAKANAAKAKAKKEELEYIEKMFALCTKAKDSTATVIINKCKAEGFL